MVYFCQMIDVLVLFNPFPPQDPRRLIHMLYMFIITYHCPKGILGLGGKASKNKLKYTCFIIPMTNVLILSVFRTHAQNGCHKVLEIKSTSIFKILALLLFEIKHCICSKTGLHGIHYKDVKMTGASRKRKYSWLCK